MHKQLLSDPSNDFVVYTTWKNSKAHTKKAFEQYSGSLRNQLDLTKRELPIF